MKPSKLMIGFLTVLLLFGLVGCSGAEPVSIEKYKWNLHTVQSGNDGVVIACSEDNTDVYPGANAMMMSCTAKDGNLAIMDTTNGKTYTGTYKHVKSSPESIIYEFMIGEEIGNAVSAMTVYQDESEKPTLILSVGGYALHFYAE